MDEVRSLGDKFSIGRKTIMAQDRLYKLFEKQRRRQILALLAVCSPEEKERILADEQERKELRRKVEKL
jgi:predicted HAD superfamily phosphohydrolase